jgi:flagellar basal-body rod protein FlgG
MEFTMSNTKLATIGRAVGRLAFVLMIAGAMYLIVDRLADLSKSTSQAVLAMANTSTSRKPIPRLPSDAEVSRLRFLSACIDVQANNLVNAKTLAFKRQRVVPAFGTKGETQISIQTEMTQGSLESTGVNTDLAIQGNGFLKVKISPNVGDGTGYTRNGSLFENHEGDLVVGIGDGYKVVPEINIPQGATDVSIAPDGTVTYTKPGANTSVTAGQIQLYQFINQQGLTQQGGGLFLESSLSGAPLQSSPGENGAGQILSGELEASNVDPIKEQVELLKTEQLFQECRAPIRLAAQAMESVASIEK